MSNLNDEIDSEGYGDDHERDDEWLRAGSAEGVEDGHDPRGSDPSHAAALAGGPDGGSLAENRGLAPGGDADDRQPPIPELAYYAQQELNFHSGPLPSPDVLARYDEVRHGTVDWIITTAGRQADVAADAIERSSKAEAAVLKVMGYGSVGLPVLGMLVGVPLVLAGVEFGWLPMVIGVTPRLFDGVAKVIAATKDDPAAKSLE